MNNLDVMNDALQLLGNMSKWRWLERPAIGLNLVADQPYVTLPADCYTLLGPPIPTDTTINGVEIVSMEELETLRRVGYSGAPYKVALVYNGTPPRARYEVVPAPTTSLLEAWLQPYRSGMGELTSEDDQLPIPAWMRPLFRQVCLAVKQGYEEHDLGSVDRRISALRAGAVYIDAVNRDAALQTRVTRLSPKAGAWDERSVYLIGSVTGPQE